MTASLPFNETSYPTIIKWKLLSCVQNCCHVYLFICRLISYNISLVSNTRNLATFPVLLVLQATYKKCNYFHYIPNKRKPNTHSIKMYTQAKDNNAEKENKNMATKTCALAFSIQYKNVCVARHVVCGMWIWRWGWRWRWRWRWWWCWKLLFIFDIDVPH